MMQRRSSKSTLKNIIAVRVAISVFAVLIFKSYTSSSSDQVCTWTSERLVGNCPPGTFFSKAEFTSANECELDCCKSPDCISWQFREGCSHGGDVRLGEEKDGPSAWCSATAPCSWKGQSVTDRSACSELTWNPEELRGQCYGLGGRKKIQGESASDCMKACCADSGCSMWQWCGGWCFFGTGFNCMDENFTPYQGGRKFLESRKYHPKAIPIE